MPVCEPKALASYAINSRRLRAARVPGVLCVRGRTVRALFAQSSRHSTVVLGASACVGPPECGRRLFTAGRLSSAGCRRASNKGVTIEDVAIESAAHHPDLRRLLGQWLEGRSLPPLHFLAEPRCTGRRADEPDHPCGRRQLRPWRSSSRLQVRGRNGYWFELLARARLPLRTDRSSCDRTGHAAFCGGRLRIRGCASD